MRDPELIPAVYGAGDRAARNSSLSSGSQGTQQTLKKRKAWVVADWKIRLPGTTVLLQESTAARRLRLKQAALERREQLASEYAELYTTIDAILQRCDGIAKTFGSHHQQRQQPEPSTQVHVTMRSHARTGAARPGTAPTVRPSSLPMAAEVPTVAAAPALILGGQQGQLWAAPIDLNPGMTFRPGTPQRTAATAPELPAVMARIAALSDDLKRLDMKQLTHRERLQAGIQQLNGDFYAALRECGMMPGHNSPNTLVAATARP